EGGIAAALRKFRTRVTRIYIAHIASMVAGLVILGVFLSQGLRLDDSSLYAWPANPSQYFPRTLLLTYSPGLFSLLPLYLILSPLALLAVPALRRWPAWVLASSFALWCTAQAGVFDFFIKRDRSVFLPFAWQFLMIIGIAAKLYW